MYLARGELWAKVMGLKCGAVGYTLGTYQELREHYKKITIGNIVET
jgi:hypothetical protein